MRLIRHRIVVRTDCVDAFLWWNGAWEGPICSTFHWRRMTYGFK